jgi:hypothetical protein
MDPKLWGNENSGRSLDRVSKCWNQPAWVDHISPKSWVARRRRFEKSRRKNFFSDFLNLALALGKVNLMELKEFNFDFDFNFNFNFA